MGAASIYPAFFIVAFVWVLLSLLLRAKPAVLPPLQKYPSIDGLRGYLALFVFLSHACIWYFYARTGTWTAPPSNFHLHLGQSSVVLFFMITAFLFTSKLMDKGKKEMDWLSFFVSRLFRITPLYFFALVLLGIIIAALSHFKLREPFSVLSQYCFEWITFTFIGTPDLNAVKGTKYIVAGVTWSLTYEWIFYLALPWLALFFYTTKKAIPVLLITGLLLFWFARNEWISLIFLYPFLGGIAAAYLQRSPVFCKQASRSISSLVIIVLLFLVWYFFDTAYSEVPILLLSGVFILIACGNTFFDSLTTPVSRILGSISYSLYLLHGIVLFVVFHFALGIGITKRLYPITHWLVIAAITIPLLFICLLTHRFIELPGMNAAKRVTAFFRKK